MKTLNDVEKLPSYEICTGFDRETGKDWLIVCWNPGGVVLLETDNINPESTLKIVNLVSMANRMIRNGEFKMTTGEEKQVFQAIDTNTYSMHEWAEKFGYVWRGNLISDACKPCT